ncbi:WhiB family transcriptional regulator [Actinomycetospora sp. CA-053990]|uniref:WhiB family transcriptional regulator n=1 Tax=Actinomycetospora sp. CA-053990 TaxID=3239891 RepID=UPI003D8F716E
MSGTKSPFVAVDGDERWADRAACGSTGVDGPWALFNPAPPSEHRAMREDRVRQAWMGYCHSCPVREQCRTDAEQNKYEGVWGGNLYKVSTVAGGGVEHYVDTRHPGRQMADA